MNLPADPGLGGPVAPVVSGDSLLSVVFQRSSSASYAAALLVARGAARRVDASAGRSVVHLAEFDPSPPQAAVAVALLRYVGAWSGVQVFVRGRPVGGAWGSIETVERVLRCYAESGAVSDPSAHCCSVERSLFDDGSPHPAAVFPCRHVLRIFPSPLSRRHPAGHVAQIEARAVASMCDFCPAFAPDALTWLP